jgi:hypothetical protein
MLQRTWARRLLLVTFVACGGSDEALGDACDHYKRTFCEWVESCNLLLQPGACQEAAESIACREDVSEAERCTQAIERASCSNPPERCNLADIADPAPAIAACEAFVTEVCRALARCGSEQPLGECESDAMHSLDCTQAIGVKAGYDACLADLPQASCDEIAPSSCERVLTIRSEE